MKFYQIIFILSIIVIGMTSCEEVIVLDLKNDEPRIVIEAVVDANAQTAGVFLTMSNGFYDDINLEVVNDATVQITQANGTVVDLPKIADGTYVAFGVEANEGDELSIVVIDGNGTEYKAITNVPHSVAIDSLGIVELTGGFGPGSGGPNSGQNKQYQIFTYWQDEANVESYYRIRSLKNDTLQTDGYLLIEDFQQEGEQLFRPIFSPFEGGDTVTVQLLSLDKNSYRYFSDLSAVQGEGPGGSSTPFNPKSNFDNDALGYFGIIRMDTETVILQ